MSESEHKQKRKAILFDLSHNSQVTTRPNTHFFFFFFFLSSFSCVTKPTHTDQTPIIPSPLSLSPWLHFNLEVLSLSLLCYYSIFLIDRPQFFFWILVYGGGDCGIRIRIWTERNCCEGKKKSGSQSCNWRFGIWIPPPWCWSFLSCLVRLGILKTRVLGPEKRRLCKIYYMGFGLCVVVFTKLWFFFSPLA